METTTQTKYPDADLLKAWGLCKVKIQSNEFIGAKRPTTQDDNFGGIVEKIDLYHVPHQLLNGTFADMRNGNGMFVPVGRLVKYFKDKYAVFHGFVRYEIPFVEIKIEN